VINWSISHDFILYIATDLCGILSMAGFLHCAKSRVRRLVGPGIIDSGRQHRDDLGFCVHALAYPERGYKTGFIS
jgi:hypothetical protein